MSCNNNNKLFNSPRHVLLFNEKTLGLNFLCPSHVSGFCHRGRFYKSVNQYMTFCKALMANDKKIMEMVMLSADDSEELDKAVINLDVNKWRRNIYSTLKQGILQKFDCNRDLAKRLLRTGNIKIVYASSTDSFLGIGMSPSRYSHDSLKWQGLNILGRVIEEVREDMTLLMDEGYNKWYQEGLGACNDDSLRIDDIINKLPL